MLNEGPGACECERCGWVDVRCGEDVDSEPAGGVEGIGHGGRNAGWSKGD